MDGQENYKTLNFYFLIILNNVYQLQRSWFCIWMS